MAKKSILDNIFFEGGSPLGMPQALLFKSRIQLLFTLIS